MQKIVQELAQRSDGDATLNNRHFEEVSEIIHQCQAIVDGLADVPPGVRLAQLQAVELLKQLTESTNQAAVGGWAFLSWAFQQTLRGQR